jgi:hypothetical protein
MDYKTRYPNIPRWSDEHLNTMRHPMPYTGPCITEIMELEAPDHSAVFLAFFGRCCIDEEMIVWYLVEAPPGDLMRNAFEAGDVTMEDFWDHRGWLIRMETKVMSCEDPVMQYIHPAQMDSESRANLQSYGDQSPYERLIEKLNMLVDFYRSRGEDASEYQRQIQEAKRHMPPRQAIATSKKIA